MSDFADMASDLRHADPIRFGASLAAPPDLRIKLWSLYALHHELARIPFTVSEPQLAEIRLQWWQDQLRALGEGRPATGHPALEAVGKEWGRNSGDLSAMVEGHRRWCDPTPFTNPADVLAMIDATNAALMQAAAGALAPDAGAGLAHVASQQGRGAGVVAFLQGWPALEAGGWLRSAPKNMMADLAKAGLTAFGAARDQHRDAPREAAPALYAGARIGKRLRMIARGEAFPAVSEFQRRFGLARLALTGRWWVSA